MKKLLIASAIVAFTAIGSPALAQTAQPKSSTNTTQPNTNTCAGNVCPGTTSWTVGGQSVFGGAGGSVFEGATGSNTITKKGSGGIDIAMKATGCATIDCTNGASSFTFNGFAREHVTVDTTAAGGVSGTPVMAQNQGVAIGALNVTIQRLQGSPAPTTAK